MARASTALTPVVEQCWTLLGHRRGRVWLCRRVHRTRGERCRVRFDGAWTLAREETHGDVIGFLHTHPDGPACPSERDVRTMRAWCGAFGKPLLCVISVPDGLCAFRFDDDASAGVTLEVIESFPRGIVIGVDTHG